VPSTRFGPVGEDVVVVGKPVHNAPRFIVFHGIGQAARWRQCFASFTELGGMFALPNVEQAGDPDLSATDARSSFVVFSVAGRRERVSLDTYPDALAAREAEFRQEAKYCEWSEPGSNVLH
jgi:hypothetical protein